MAVMTVVDHERGGQAEQGLGRKKRDLSVAPAMAWPLADRLDLGALPSAIPCARLHTRAILAEWGLTHLNHTAELVISELATNALQATRAASLTSALIIYLHANDTYVSASGTPCASRPLSMPTTSTLTTAEACRSWRPSATTGALTTPPMAARSSTL